MIDPQRDGTGQRFVLPAKLAIVELPRTGIEWNAVYGNTELGPYHRRYRVCDPWSGRNSVLVALNADSIRVASVWERTGLVIGDSIGSNNALIANNLNRDPAWDPW